MSSAPVTPDPVRVPAPEASTVAPRNAVSTSQSGLAAGPQPEGTAPALPQQDQISDAQRSGSLTGVGIILAFSLTFTGQFSQGTGAWTWRGAIPMIGILLGIGIQLSALLPLLVLPPVTRQMHTRIVRRFQIGVIVTLLTFAGKVVWDMIAELPPIGTSSSPGASSSARPRPDTM